MSYILTKIEICYSAKAFLPRLYSFGINYFIISLPISLLSFSLLFPSYFSAKTFGWTAGEGHLGTLDRCHWIVGSLSLWSLEKNPPRGWGGRDRWRRTRLVNTFGSTGGVEGQRVHLDLPARLVQCQNDDVSQRRREAIVWAYAEHGFGIRWKGGWRWKESGFDFVVSVWWKESGGWRWQMRRVELVTGWHLGVLENIIKNNWKNNIIIK